MMESGVTAAHCCHCSPSIIVPRSIIPDMIHSLEGKTVLARAREQFTADVDGGAGGRTAVVEGGCGIA